MVQQGVATGVSRFDYALSDFKAVQSMLLKKTGISLSESKRQMVYSRLSRRLHAIGLSCFSDYLRYLTTHPEEEQEFINALTTNLTAFFRERHHFEVLADHARYVAQQGRKLRCWCAAASTGEEAYSMAMTLVNVWNRFDIPAEIIASDIDSRVLDTARKGIYDVERINGISDLDQRRFFLRGKGENTGKVKVIDPLKALVQFRQLNLLDTPWPLKPPFDVIFCRNVMIYFDKKTQLTLLEKMVPLLRPDGIYIAGHSESFVQAGHVVVLAGKSVYRPVAGVSSYDRLQN